MIRIWKGLPEWAQWCLYLPSCILFPALGGGLVSLPAMVNDASKASLAIVLPLSALVATVVFYWCAFYLAPRAKKIAAGILFLIFVALWGMTAFHTLLGWYLSYFDVEFLGVIQLIQALIAISLGSYLFLSAFRDPEPMEM